MKANIVYSTDQIARQYTRSRIAWRQFYESERVVIGQLKLDHRHAILDAGRGCGGLGMALRDQFGAENYTGVKINVSAAESG